MDKNFTKILLAIAIGLAVFAIISLGLDIADTQSPENKNAKKVGEETSRSTATSTETSTPPENYLNTVDINTIQKINPYSTENQTENRPVSIWNVPTTEKPAQSEEKIAVSPDQSEARTFGNKTGQIFNKYVDVTSDGAVIEKSTKFPTPETFQGLRKISDNYRKLSDEIDALNPPADGQTIKSDLVSNYRLFSDVIGEMAGYENQPLITVGTTTLETSIPGDLFQRYTDGAIAVTTAFASAIGYFEMKGVVFSSNEDGAIFSY